jgi:hypothetical protein
MVAAVDIGDHDPFAIPAARAPRDDPFARALRETEAEAEPDAAAVEPTLTLTLVGPLAQRDPRLAADESAEVRITGASSFDDVLRRARRRGFLSGCAAGAVVAAAVAAVLAQGAPPRAAAAIAPGAEPQRERPPAAPPTGGAVDPPAAPPMGAAVDPPAAPAPAAELARAPSAAPGGSSTRRSPVATARKVPRDARQAWTAARPGGGKAVAATGLDLRARERHPKAGHGEAVAPAPADGGARPAAEASAGDAPAAGDPAPAAAPRLLGDGEVSAALEVRRDAIDGCAAAAAGDAASATGRRFLLLVAIDPDGTVAEARIDDPAIHATALGTCLVRIAREMSFAPFDGAPVRVELPLRFGGADGNPDAH